MMLLPLAFSVVSQHLTWLGRHIFSSEELTVSVQVSIEILSPIHGASVDSSDPQGLPLHVKVHGMDIPAEGYAQVTTCV